MGLSQETERTRRLTGYIQIYNMQGLSLRQVSSKDVAEKLKGALSAGGFYVEAVAHIYVINASRLFSMAWKLVRGFLSPWTASKITVSSDVPPELIAELGGQASSAALELRKLLTAAREPGPPMLSAVLRPRGQGATSPRRASEESVCATSSTRYSEPSAEGMLYGEEKDVPAAWKKIY